MTSIINSFWKKQTFAKLILTRNGDFVTLGGKFPRLTKKEPKTTLKEIKRLLLALGAIVTGEMVKHQKPALDIFLEAARLIGVNPKFCRAYEDTELGPEFGLQAIRAAGMEAVDVRKLISRSLTS